MSTTSSFARIRRGTMAADRFTQIANDLFRDQRLSYKAKGIFGVLASHRDGYGITPRRLAEQSTDGLDAIKSGLQELERCGYLVRHQERRPNGTLGPVEYLITDTPDPLPPSSPPVTENPSPAPTSQKTQSRRSQPVADYPLAAEPSAANPTPKNTNNKNTSKQKTNPTRPPAPEVGDQDGEVGQPAQEPTTAQPEPTPGQALLWEAADRIPQLTLTGATVRRLAPKADELLRRGWTRSRILTVLTADTDDLTHPRGALAWRIDDLLATPVPQAETTPAAQQRAADKGVHRECPGDEGMCGRPLTVGETLCRSCCATGHHATENP
ncbi:helix-turn-helix domain-containing protein [Streptacidiphilus neutrinimicus]|uniref:helix-turn-helix domain-containing protein n=1 Tax=Streptacidiphilus neutrinimicus TaxID=105420 RepID=UPI0006944C0E|nr:helix-turn-helix domain-containing protein [Streptacidiphilus neutrinimicus]